MCPFEVGQTYLIQTVTLYYVGRVSRIVGGFVEMENASWVHWTGRLSTLCQYRDFQSPQWPSSHQTPRTEYVDKVGVSMAAIVAYVPGEFKLPLVSI